MTYSKTTSSASRSKKCSPSARPALLLRAAAHDPLCDVIALLSRELSGPAPGQQTVLDRLLDVLLVLAMRACFEQSPTAPRWYEVSGDPRLSPALHAIHAEAGHPWTARHIDGEIAIVEIIDSKKAPRIDLWVGIHDAAHATALGKSIGGGGYRRGNHLPLRQPVAARDISLLLVRVKRVPVFPKGC